MSGFLNHQVFEYIFQNRIYVFLSKFCEKIKMKMGNKHNDMKVEN